MKITKEFLIKNKACTSGIQWFERFKDKAITNDDWLKLAKEYDHLDYINWFITKKMTKKQCILYSIYSSEKVLYIFEKEYPKDKRPLNAINAAKEYLKNPTKKNKDKASASASASAAAAYASAAAAYAAYVSSAYAYASAAAAYAAYVSSAAAAYASAAAAYAYKDMLEKILEYGVYLLEEVRNEKI